MIGGDDDDGLMAPVIVNGFKGTATRSWGFGSESAEFVMKGAWARRLSNSMHVSGKSESILRISAVSQTQSDNFRDTNHIPLPNLVTIYVSAWPIIL
jgi:hypothetical protein